MIRSALLLCAALLAAVMFACAPLTESAPQQRMLMYQTTGKVNVLRATCTNVDVFNAKLFVLNQSPRFNPDDVFPDYTPPTAVSQVVDPSVDNPTPILDDLDAAFCNSPDFFKTHLLGLTAIYVNPADCVNGNAYTCNLPGKEIVGESWGFRERPAQYDAGKYPASPGRYIAISAGLWKGGKPAADFAAFETQLLNRLLKWPGPAGNQPYFGPSTNPNASWMTALAALAHELGHVRWYDLNVPDPTDGSYDFTALTNACPDQKSFSTASWQDTDVASVQSPRWRNFGERQNKNKGRPLSQLDNAIAKGNFRNAGPWLAEKYSKNAPWASFFATTSPDEDFVETYVFNVLRGANLTTLPITIPYVSAPLDIFADYVADGKNSEFNRKVVCVYNTKDAQPFSTAFRYRRYR